MKLEDLTESSDSVDSKLKAIVKKVGYSNPSIKKTTINNIYNEYALTVDLDKEYFNDRSFASSKIAKSVRKEIKKDFGEQNLRSKSVVAVVASGKGKFIFQLKGQ